MLFESRKILLGFRIKILFQSSLKLEDSYVFVSTSKIHTIKDLLEDIKERFQIPKDIYLTLNDCPILDSEDILVLNDVDEVKILPVSKKHRTFTQQSPAHETENHEDVIKVQHQSNGFIPTKGNNFSKSISNSVEKIKPDEPDGIPIKTPSTTSTNRKRRFYGSIAETIALLTQNQNEAKTETSTAETKILDENNDSAQKETANNEEASFDEIGDESIEKKKRKRKRKHSKKPRLNSEYHDEIPSDYIEKVEKKESTREISIDAPRQHIFFPDEEENGKEETSRITNYNRDVTDSLKINQSSLANERDIRNTEKNTIISNNFEMEVDTMNEISGNITDNGVMKTPQYENEKITHPIREDCNSFRNNSFQSATANAVELESSQKKSKNSFCEMIERKNSAISDSRSNHLLANVLKYKELKTPAEYNKEYLNCGTSFEKKASVNSLKSESIKTARENKFFDKFNPSKFTQQENIPTAGSQNADALATLLMCKQLQTPVEYNLQFSNSNYKSRSRKSSISNTSSNNVSVEEPVTIKTETKTADDDCTVNNNANDDECEVLCQYKVVDDNIILRNSSGSWITLTPKDAFLNLQPLKEPQENQTITFQILYLSQDMCPQMSNLLCGKVIKYSKEDGKLILNILPSFIDALLKDCGEDGSLPEELVHIADNAYEIVWAALKNPRLVM